MVKYYSNNYLEFHLFEDGGMAMFITPEGLNKIGDIVWVELPQDRHYQKGEVFFTVETNKSVIEVTAPMDLDVADYNEEFLNTPDCMTPICVLDDCDVSGLMNESQYMEFVKADN